MAQADVVELTRKLIAEDTVNPPGREQRCIDPLHVLLAEAGFEVARHVSADGRPNLVARLEGSGGGQAIGFTGHVDVVPLGDAPWTRAPFGGEIEGDRLYGRGSADMKGGVAAFVCAAMRWAGMRDRKGAVELAITASEEIGLLGAIHLAQTEGALGSVGALVVAEPSSNAPIFGHRGLYWGEMRFSGRTAHASMPHEGDNAIMRAARALTALDGFAPEGFDHPYLGSPTFSVSTIEGGDAMNAVPDRVKVGFDCRPTPSLSAEKLEALLRERMAEPVEIAFIERTPSLWTDPKDPWMVSTKAYLDERRGRKHPIAVASYSTDAAVLTPAYGGCPTMILGPGEAAQAHQTDEWCSIEMLREAEDLYFHLMTRWGER